MTKLWLYQELIYSDLCQSCVKFTLTCLGLMQSKTEPICWSDPTKITQAGDINSDCNISPCTIKFPLFTSFSNPQDVTVFVSGPICTMPCLFKTCKQMLGNTLLSCCIMFHVSQEKIQSLVSCMHPYENTHKRTHVCILCQTWACTVTHTLNPTVECLCIFLLSILNCGLASQP